MIRLRSYRQAAELSGSIPALALLRMRQLEGDGLYDPESHGYLIVIEEGDRLDQDLPEAGDGGLRIGGEEWDCPPFEYVRCVRENGSRVYEAVIAINNEKMIVLIIPETLSIPPDLRSLLEATAEEETVTD